MAKIKIWVHLVWGVADKESELNPSFRKVIYSQLQQIAAQNKIITDFINGTADHIHCLLLMPENLTINQTVELLKEKSQEWLLQTKIVKSFAWDDDFLAVSVSESMVEKVREYIQNQETIHAKKTFTEETAEFSQRHEFSKIRIFSTN